MGRGAEPKGNLKPEFSSCCTESTVIVCCVCDASCQASFFEPVGKRDKQPATLVPLAGWERCTYRLHMYNVSTVKRGRTQLRSCGAIFVASTNHLEDP